MTEEQIKQEDAEDAPYRKKIVRPTKQEVFDALLGEYEDLFREYAPFMKDPSAIDLEIQDWKDAYRRAI